MLKFADQKGERLIFINRRSDNEYWDQFWKNREVINYRQSSKYFVDITKKYLPKDSKILEGGSGLGDKVKGLQAAGFNAIGVDYAIETVKDSIKRYPGLDIRVGDVRELEFEDSYFDGYWSLGVIEHFWNGYHEIIDEANRVLRSEGILFLTFPSMSMIRKIKTKTGMYKKFSNSDDIPDGFYQYALEQKNVISDLENAGFKIMKVARRSPEKGIDEEMNTISSFLKFIEYKFPKIIFRITRKLLVVLLNPIVGHGSIIIAKKVRHHNE